MDQLTHLPSTADHAILLAIHIQHLTLELHRLYIYIDVVKKRVAHPSFVATNVLPVHGAFTSDASIAQDLFLIGIPVWYIQPITKKVRIVKLVELEPISDKLDVKLGYPCLDTTWADMSSIITNPARWLFKMQEEVLTSLLDNALPPLPVWPQEDADGPLVKKAKVNELTGRVEVVLGSAAGSSSKKKTHRSTRAPPKTPTQPQPSLTFMPPSAGDIPKVWQDSLKAAGTLPHLATSAEYFWLPPFLLDLQMGRAATTATTTSAFVAFVNNVSSTGR